MKNKNRKLRKEEKRDMVKMRRRVDERTKVERKLRIKRKKNKIERK